MKLGKAKQVETFGKLVGSCNNKGAMYNPVNDSLKVPALNQLLTDAQKSLEAENNLESAYKQAVLGRRTAFDALPTLVRRVYHAVNSAEVPATVSAEAARFRKRFSPTKKNRPASLPAVSAANGDPPADAGVSRSYFDYANKIQNFKTLVTAIEETPQYAANESDLKIETLKTHVANLEAMNQKVLNTFLSMQQARTTCNKFLYQKTGIHTIGLKVKNYLKAAFGSSSTEYTSIKSLTFRKLKA